MSLIFACSYKRRRQNYDLLVFYEVPSLSSLGRMSSKVNVVINATILPSSSRSGASLHIFLRRGGEEDEKIREMTSSIMFFFICE